MTSIVIRDLPKTGTLETLNLYIKDAPVFYAVIHEPKLKYQSTDKEFSVTIFIDEETKDKLEDEIAVNKTFSKVGLTKTSKPPKRIKFPLSSQVEEGKVNYDAVEGMWGFTVTRPEFSKKGNPMTVNVIDKEGKPFTENVGNGSIVNLKLFGYKNQDGQLVVSLDTMQVIDHVPYEQKSGSDSVADDVFGVTYQVKKVESVKDSAVEAKSQEIPKQDDLVDSDPFPF